MRYTPVCLYTIKSIRSMKEINAPVIVKSHASVHSDWQQARILYEVISVH